MISHFNLGTNDLARAEAFYNELLKAFDAKQLFKSERSIFYSLGDNSAKLAINTPFNGEPATHGNGSMVAFSASGKEQVDALHSAALAAGGSCDGAPGERMDGMIYAAYFRDPDGNKFGVFYAPNTIIG